MFWCSLVVHAIGSKLCVIRFGHKVFWIYHLQYVPMSQTLFMFHSGHKMYSYQWPSGTTTITVSTIVLSQKYYLTYYRVLEFKGKDFELLFWTLSQTDRLLVERGYDALYVGLIMTYMYIGFGIEIGNSSSYVNIVLEQGCATVLLIGSFLSVSRLYRTPVSSGATVIPHHPTPLCFITWIRQNYIFNLI